MNFRQRTGVFTSHYLARSGDDWLIRYQGGMRVILDQRTTPHRWSWMTWTDPHIHGVSDTLEAALVAVKDAVLALPPEKRTRLAHDPRASGTPKKPPNLSEISATTRHLTRRPARLLTASRIGGIADSSVRWGCIAVAKRVVDSPLGNQWTGNMDHLYPDGVLGSVPSL